MRFDAHVDTSWKGAHPGEETEFTLLFYLNSSAEPVPSQGVEQPLVGGDTVFQATAKTELCRVQPSAGLALLHAHGRRCLMHYAEEVSRGVKYVLRADVMYRRKDAAPSAASPNGQPHGQPAGNATPRHGQGQGQGHGKKGRKK